LANDVDVDGDVLTVISVSDPSHGVVSTDGTFVYYSPDLDYYGADGFGYTIIDGNGGSDSASVSVTVVAVNDQPVAVDDFVTVSEDSVGNVFDVLVNDFDIDGDLLNITGVTIPAHGTASFNGTHVFYSPDGDYYGADQFGYTISDGQGDSDSATVYVTVDPVNDDPVAGDDSVTVSEDSVGNQVDVLGNDVDIDGDSLSIIGVSDPGFGVVSTDGIYVYYTPDPNYHGADSFTYTISDGHGGSDSATVFVTVSAVNDPPVAGDDSATVAEDSVDNEIDVLANDVDIDGDDLDIVGVTTPSHGTVTFTVAFVYYTPDPDYTGSDQFSYTVSDNNGGTDGATVYISVGGTNDPPVAVDDSVSVAEDSVSNLVDVLGNDFDPDGDTLTVLSVTDPVHGVASTDGSVVWYTPDGDYNGADSFDYTIFDGVGGTDIGTVFVTVSAVNDPPVAVDDSASVLEDSSNNLIYVLANDVDVDGDSLTVVGVTTPGHGIASFTADYVLYTPDGDYNGADSFNYTVSDGNGGSDTASVSVTVTPRNDDPVASDDSITVDEDTVNNVVSVLVNDVDIDGDSLSVVSVANPPHGSATTNGSVVFYSPDLNFHGSDSFDYTVSDGNGGTDVGTVFVTVNSVNDPPNANSDTATVIEDSINNQIVVLANDFDIDGDSLNVSAVSDPVHGVASTDGVFVYYTPDSNFAGADQFTYTVDDGNGGFDTATVFVTVTGVNDAPDAVDDTVSVPEDSSDNQLNVLANDYDIDGDDLDIVSVTSPSHGTATYTNNYVYYTPTPDYNGPDQLSYTITDNNGGTDSATVYVTVGALNDPPVAGDDSATVDEDSVDNVVSVLLNDMDPDGDTLTVVSVSDPVHGATSTDGSVVFYSPDVNYHGADSFTYTISDGHGGTDTGLVSVTVTSVNDPPVAVDDLVTVAEDSSNNLLYVLMNDNDVDGDALTITSVTIPVHGVVTYTANFVYYTPDGDYNGADQFDYFISDGNGGSDSATVFVTVSAVNDPPVAVDDSFSVVEDSSDNQLNVLGNDYDVDGDELDISSV
jgi:hypothetical protein